MTQRLFFCLLVCSACSRTLFSQTLAERLGYPATAKLLIIHADDLAVAHSENAASIHAMKEGVVNSASVMIPCPWLPEVADYARKNPNHDLGLHLTLTSEWQPYKWGSVAPASEVSSLVDSNGYFYNLCTPVHQIAKPQEVERELRAQVEKAKAMGLEPTHFDSHMGCLFMYSPELFAIYMKLGREYGVPTMVSQDFLATMPEEYRKSVTDKDIVVDRVFTAEPQDYAKGMPQYYSNVLKTLPSGVHVLLIHTAYDNEEMKSITVGHEGVWDSAWRQADYGFFTSEACKKLIKEQGIQLITWREIGKLLKK